MFRIVGSYGGIRVSLRKGIKDVGEQEGGWKEPVTKPRKKREERRW